MPRPVLTRRALLDAGRTEFARHGLAGGRTDRIAAASGVNKQRIYAYFGSKEGLFEAVVDDALQDLLDVVPLPADAPDAATLAREYVGNLVAYHSEHPELMRLVQWESLERTSTVDLAGPRAVEFVAKARALAYGLGLTQDQAASLLLQLTLLAAGPQALRSLTSMALAAAPEAALIKAGESAVAAAATLVTAAVAQHADPQSRP